MAEEGLVKLNRGFSKDHIEDANEYIESFANDLNKYNIDIFPGNKSIGDMISECNENNEKFTLNNDINNNRLLNRLTKVVIWCYEERKFIHLSDLTVYLRTNFNQELGKKYSLEECKEYIIKCIDNFNGKFIHNSRVVIKSDNGRDRYTRFDIQLIELNSDSKNDQNIEKTNIRSLWKDKSIVSRNSQINIILEEINNKLEIMDCIEVMKCWNANNRIFDDYIHFIHICLESIKDYKSSPINRINILKCMMEKVLYKLKEGNYDISIVDIEDIFNIPENKRNKSRIFISSNQIKLLNIEAAIEVSKESLDKINLAIKQSESKELSTRSQSAVTISTLISRHNFEFWGIWHQPDRYNQ